jgi:tetratricopeptide (TPR) repeat protein
MLKYLIILSFFMLGACASQEKIERAQLRQNLGLSYYEQGNYPMALKEFLIAEELNPKDPAIHNNLGLTYFMRERYELAEKHLKKSIDIQPKFTEARNNLARLYIEMKEHEKAEKELAIVLNDLTYTGMERAYMNYGLLYFNQGRFDKSRESFLKSVKIRRDSCSANSFLGRTYFELKNYTKAAEILDGAIGYCQKELFDEPHYYSALTYYRLGKTEKAAARFDEILKLYPQGMYRDKSRAMLEILKGDGK